VEHLRRKDGRPRGPLGRHLRHQDWSRRCGATSARPREFCPGLVRDLAAGRYWWFGLRAGFDQ
jgi:hypothetical protein